MKTITPPSQRLPITLTPAETAVHRLIARGLPNKLIAYELGVSTNCVRIHASNLYRKLGVTNRVQAALARHGIAWRTA